MAALSILSYNLPQGLIKMKPNSSSSSTPPPAHSNNNNNNNGGIIITGNSNSINLSKTFNKITVQNVLSENNGNTLNISNNVNTIVRKIKDFGMFGSVNNTASSGSLNTMAARKRPLGESKMSNVDNAKLAVPATKKPMLTKVATIPKSAKKSLENVNQPKVVICGNGGATVPVKTCGTPGRKGLPLPQAVARRNARERNRVKQVNNGFAALRERIPEEVAEVFEVQEKGRGGQAKKLSKVETLRMAVEYIRNLESLLGFDFPMGGGTGSSARGSSSGEDSFTLIKDEFDAVSPEMDDQFDDNLSNYDVDEFFNNTNASLTVDTSISHQSQSTSYLEQSEQQQSNVNTQSNQMDILPDITTLNGFQYIRIPGTNTYQLLTPDIFVGNSHSPPNSSIDEEQFNALIDTNCLSPVASSSVTTTADLHSSPPSIIAETTANASAPAGTPTTATTRIMTNGECVNIATSSLSRSPVPQTSSPNASSSLHHHHQQQQQHQQHHRQQQLLQPAMLSPAANELLMQTCATTDRLTNDDRQFVAPIPPQQYLQPRMIKQEFNETDFISTTPSPTANALTTSNVIYQMSSNDQQQQQQIMLNHPTLTMSPPLDRCSSTNAPTSMHPTSAELQAFYDHDQSGSFYEGVVTFKKELNDVLLDTSSVTAGLSDESMMEAIDWWEAHTPKSDGGSVIL